MSISIFLDNYNTVCYPGQTISGRIECTFNNEKNLRAIRVKFRGRAKTAWTESESHYNSVSKKSETRHVHFSAEESYMDAEYNLVQGGENFTLAAGKHVYPFSYILPPSLPSSFEGSVGNIRYYVKAVVDRPWKFDYEARVPLNVASLIDLNFIPGLRDPVALSDDKTMCSCWCNDAGALTFNISMPVGGYVPGQEINIGSYVQNLTNVTAERVQFKLTANYEFITHHPRTHTRNDYDEIARCSEGGVGAHGEKSWTSTLVLPTNRIYPNLIPCSIINVYYNLEAKVVVPCPHTNLELNLPIMIGSVPLSGVNTTIPGPPLPGSEFASNSPNAPLINPNSSGYPPSNNYNSSYPEKQPGGVPPPYQEKYPGGVPPPYLSGGGEGASAPYAPMDGSSPYPPGASAPPPGVVPSYPPPAGGSAPYPPPAGGSGPYPPPAGGSAPYPPPAGGSGPYPPPAGGSAPYPPPAGGSGPYPPPAGGSSPYPPPAGGSAPYPPPAGGSGPYPPSAGGSAPYPPPSGVPSSYPPEKTGWLGPNPRDATASAPPPSYEESQPQEKK